MHESQSLMHGLQKMSLEALFYVAAQRKTRVSGPISIYPFETGMSPSPVITVMRLDAPQG